MAQENEIYDNIAMLRNQAETIDHHAKEFKEAVNNADETMPWVVAKAAVVSSNLSDISHYTESNNELESYEDGGYVDHDIDDFDTPHHMAMGGRMQVGRTYRAKDGNSYRYVGNDYFMDAMRNYVKKDKSDFEGHTFEDGGVVSADEVVPGARFGTGNMVFVVEDIEQTEDGETYVTAAVESDREKTFRDTLPEFVEIMSQQGVRRLDHGGELETGAIMVYGKTQSDNYQLGRTFRELNIPAAWFAREGHWAVMGDDETLDELTLRLPDEFEERGIDARIEYVRDTDEEKYEGYYAGGGKVNNQEHMKFFEEEVNEMGYSYSDYTPAAWKQIFFFLLEEGFEDWEAKEVMLSKYMRWCRDAARNAGKRESQLSSFNDFKKCYSEEGTKEFLKKMIRQGYEKGGYMAEGGRVNNGDVVRIKNPMPDENPDQLYLVVQEHLDEYGPDDQIEVMALGTGMSIPGVNRVEMKDLEVVENSEKMENGGKTKDISKLKAALYDLKRDLGNGNYGERLSVNDSEQIFAREKHIRADIRHWGNWEHDYNDNERDEDDFEDDDFMILSDSSAKKLDAIVESIEKRNPEIKIEWQTGEKNYIWFIIGFKGMKYAEGGETKKWQDVVEGDFANVVAENKTGMVMKAYGRRFHLRFPDGTEKTYIAEELRFVHDDKDFKDGGRLKNYEYRIVLYCPSLGYDHTDRYSIKAKSVEEAKDIAYAKWQKEYPEYAGETVEVLTEKEWENKPYNKGKSKMAKGGGMSTTDKLFDVIRKKSKSLYDESSYVVYLSGDKVKIGEYDGIKPYAAQADSDGYFKVSFGKHPNQYIFTNHVKEVITDRDSFEKHGGLIYTFIPITEKLSSEIIKKVFQSQKMEKGGDTKYWIQGATKKKGALRAEAKRMGLIKGDEKLTMEDLKKLEAKGGKTAQRARLAMTLQKLRGGGKVKFKDKVASVKKSLLERKKVPKSVQKDYGKTYSPAEAQESAQRIVGAMTAAERIKMRIKSKKNKK